MLSFAQEMEKTRVAASQITCWCALIALHQVFGVGADRLNRIQEELEKIQEAYSNKLAEGGSKLADEWLRGQIGDRVTLEFRVPLTRAPRGWKEEQLRMAGDEAARIAWQIYALACINALEFGKKRLTQLHEEAWKNYEQVNGWMKEGGMEYAFSQICKCAKLALREELQVIDNNPEEGWSQYKAEFDARRKIVNRVKVSPVLAKPVPHSEQEKAAIFERCLLEVTGSARQCAVSWKGAN